MERIHRTEFGGGPCGNLRSNTVEKQTPAERKREQRKISRKNKEKQEEQMARTGMDSCLQDRVKQASLPGTRKGKEIHSNHQRQTFLATLVFFNREKFLETLHNCVFQHIPTIKLFQLCSALLMSTILTLQLFPTQKFSCNASCVFRTDEHYAYLTHFTAVHTVNIYRHYTFSALFSVAHLHYSQPPFSSLDKNTEP